MAKFAVHLKNSSTLRKLNYQRVKKWNKVLSESLLFRFLDIFSNSEEPLSLQNSNSNSIEPSKV